MRTGSDWHLDYTINDLGEVVHWPHTHRVPLGYWGSPKPYDHILEWCKSTMGEPNVSWRAYRADFGASLMVQFQNETDAAIFVLTWSGK